MRCTQTTHAGKICKNSVCNGTNFCNIHVPDCPICYEKLSQCDDAIKTTCGHWFHSGCIYKCLENDNRCPMCRTVLKKPKITIKLSRDVNPNDLSVHLLHPILNDFYERGLLVNNQVGITRTRHQLTFVDLPTGSVIGHHDFY
jgi:hypothetical protein